MEGARAGRCALRGGIGAGLPCRRDHSADVLRIAPAFGIRVARLDVRDEPRRAERGALPDVVWQSHTPAWLLALAAPFLLPGWLTGLLVTLAIVNIACLPAVYGVQRLVVSAVSVARDRGAADPDGCRGRCAYPSMALRTGLPYGTESSAGRPVPRRLILSVFTVALCVLSSEKRELEASSISTASNRVMNALAPTWRIGFRRCVRHHELGERQRPLLLESQTLAWDALDPAWLDRAIAYARARATSRTFCSSGGKSRCSGSVSAERASRRSTGRP